MPDGAVRLVIVIINYQTAQLVIQCLGSLRDELLQENCRVIVVDNCSSDGSPGQIQKWIEEHDSLRLIDILESPSNTGFAGGNNLGIQAIDADFYLLLNSDTIVRPGTISKMMATAEAHPEAGIIGPRLEWLDGTPQESCFRYLTPLSELIGAAQTGPVTAILKKYVVPIALGGTAVEPEWMSFACALLRRDMIDEIGLLDEGFFMYFEDVEYCHRARDAGWRLVHNPDARVVHLRGGSSPVKRQILERRRLPQYYYASRTRYFYLVYGWWGLTLANLLWQVGRIVSKSRELVERRQRGVPERSWIDIWTNWRHPATAWSDGKGG